MTTKDSGLEDRQAVEPTGIAELLKHHLTLVAQEPEVSLFLARLIIEVNKARKKFPTNEDRGMALMEEAGEVAGALLEHKYGNKNSTDVYKECVQAACTALRIAVEGDSAYPYDPKEVAL